MIKDISIIKNIVENEYKIDSPEAYIEYKKEKFTSGLTLDEINRLSPDNIDSGSFWEYLEDHSIFGKDSIAYGFKHDAEIDAVNAHNFNLACSLGIFNYILIVRHQKMNFLDIGAGYGMMKKFIEGNTNFIYHGADVYPKMDGIFKIEDCILPDEIMKNRYGMIVATNVFQHLSVRQRNEYYRQVSEILSPGGIFSVSNMFLPDDEKKIGFPCTETGKRYTCHYGQYTEIQNINEVYHDLLAHFDIMATAFRGKYDITTHCQLKKA